jgi:hypothetical protein
MEGRDEKFAVEKIRALLVEASVIALLVCERKCEDLLLELGELGGGFIMLPACLLSAG